MIAGDLCNSNNPCIISAQLLRNERLLGFGVPVLNSVATRRSIARCHSVGIISLSDSQLQASHCFALCSSSCSKAASKASNSWMVIPTATFLATCLHRETAP